MKTKTLILLSAALLLTVPSCKKQGQWSKHVITEEYEYVNPQTAEAAQQEKAPKLWSLKAMWLARTQLKEMNIIGKPAVVPVKIGYYECNDLLERENLYKAQVNGLMDITYSEIKNQYDNPTYWVDIALTAKGKALIQKEKKPVYPEDTITREHMLSILSPQTGMNQYGEYIFDQNVDEAIVQLIKNFYGAYPDNKNIAINTYGTPDLMMARQRILTAEELGLNRLPVDPFLRDVKIDSAALQDMSVVKWNSFVDLYVASIAGQDFCIVIKDMDGSKKIDDVALNIPARLTKNKTMRCTAKGITAMDLYHASKGKASAKPKHADARKAAKPAAPKAAKSIDLPYDEYMPQLQPGIVAVEHTEPTLYQKAKMLEHYDICNLIAGEYKFKKLGKLKDVQPGILDVPAKTATVTIERTNVSPIGRIFLGMKKGETEVLDVIFYYEDDEWQCSIKGVY